MKKKNLKGMTLVEIIVALAIFAMLGVVLVRLGTNVDSTTKSSNRLNKRVAIQAPYAASQDVDYSYEVTDEDGNVSVVDAKLTPNLTNIEIYIDSNEDNTPDVVSVKKKGKAEKEDVDSDTKIYGQRYSTKAVVDGNNEVYRTDDVSNSNHHLQFISIIDVLEEDVALTEGGAPYQLTYPDSTDLDESGNPKVKPLSNAVWTGSENAELVATISSTGLVSPVSAGECVYTGVADGGIRLIVNIKVET